MGDKLELPEDEWRRRLTPEQYEIARRKGTERAFTGEHWDRHEAGMYRCVCCGAPLFSSETKFDSGTGWPSFFKPAAANDVVEVQDTTYGMVRTEVEAFHTAPIEGSREVEPIHWNLVGSNVA